MNHALPRNAYGLLLAFDGYGVPEEYGSDAARLKDFLYRFPQTIAMRRLDEPRVIAIDEPGIRGLSGFTFIMESHVSIHTYTERGFVTADIYSCKDFDTEQAANLLAEFFATTSYHTHTLVRGRSFGETGPRVRKRDAGNSSLT